LLARELFNIRVGKVAALIVSVHPLLVHFSATACSEALFIFLVTSASYVACKAIYAPQARYSAAAGALFGLAYLTRIEGAPLVVIAFVVFLAVICARYRQQCFPMALLARDVCRAVLMPAVFLLIAAPYIIFLHTETGQWRLEGKSPLNIQTALRVALANENIWKVHYEVDRDLNERGIWIRPYNDTIATAHLELADLARYIAAEIQSKTILWLGGTILGVTPDGISFGTPLFFLLSLIGLLFSIEKQNKIAGQCLLLAFVGTFLFQALLIVFHNVRFLIVLIPTMAVWAAAGAVVLYAWVRQKSAATVSYNYFAARRTNVLLGVAVGVIVVACHAVALGRPPISWFDKRWRPVVEAAQSLAEAKQRKRPVLVGSSTIAFYANADYCAFPYTDEATALRYLDKRGVKFFILTETMGQIQQAPYLASWWAHGVPSRAAVLVGEVTGGEKVRFYRWRQESKAALDPKP
jgi:4-amino-4-deoxy-L-arabinose transferase-like glycosyltransferase